MVRLLLLAVTVVGTQAMRLCWSATQKGVKVWQRKVVPVTVKLVSPCPKARHGMNARIVKSLIGTS
jgi:hypothetical protein